MTIKVATLLTCHVALGRLAAEQVASFKTAYRISRLLKRVQAELEIADPKRIEIWKKFGTAKDDGSIQSPTDPVKVKEFSDALKEFTESTIETDLQPIKASELEEAKVTISPADIAALGELLEWDIKD